MSKLDPLGVLIDASENQPSPHADANLVKKIYDLLKADLHKGQSQETQLKQIEDTIKNRVKS